MTVEQAKAFAGEVLAPRIHSRRVALTIEARHLPAEPLPAPEAVAGPFQPFSVGDRWGGMWSTTWFHFTGPRPSDWAPADTVAAIHLGGARTVGFSAEGLVWDRGLRPLQGLHHEHRELPLPAGDVDFYVEAAANPIPRWHMRDWPRLEPDYRGRPLYALEQADLALVDREVEALWLDFRVAIEMAEWMPDRREEVLAALDEATKVPVPAARAILVGLRRPGRPGRHAVTAVGHAHIDTAWLWPVRETRRKCARTFANQLALLEHYPEHRFACSSAAHYAWVKDDHPGLYERVRHQVAAGRWEAVGGMWVEPDTNVPCGESLVRQLVHGKRFFLDEFGVETAELWIPDVFGYSAALPQIARSAGVTALVTQKMSWNDTNRFPHSTFWWEGHDGSRLLAHFPPAATYNGNADVPELLNADRNFIEADRSRLSLYPFGYGDGGGGPSRHQLEKLRRLADIDGLPSVDVGTAGRFLARLRDEGAELDVWVGELYLEYHRATMTTHADAKLGNRRSEEALRAAELWAAAAGLAAAERLDPLWKRLLVNQFHDILPGSSIGWVYRDAAADHAAVLEGCAQVIEEASSALAGTGKDQVVFNAGSHARREVAEVDGRPVWVEVPACGWAPLGCGAPPGPVTRRETVLDNGILRVTIDPTGLLSSVWDHEAGREVLAPGSRGNLFQLHEDHPKAFDAWDVDREYLHSVEDLDGELEELVELEAGPMSAAVRTRRAFGEGGSWIDQTIRLAAGSRRVEFHTGVEWQERHRFLKVAFPVDVRASRATYEIQHGHVERPTHENTSWDRARFEVCAHRFADLSEAGYGVALLNDCKYGYDVRGHTMRLSLLRGPGYPDPDADRGRHRFAYALLPHRGDLREGRVVEEAEAFNLPLLIRPGSVSGPRSFVSVDRPGVSIEAVKRSDDGDGLIVRLCEVHGARGPATLAVGQHFTAAVFTDLLERPLDRPPPLCEAGTVRLQLRPFELVTIRLSDRLT